MSGEVSEQDESTQEDRNQVEMDSYDETRRNKGQEDDNSIQTKTGEISVFNQYKSTI